MTDVWHIDNQLAQLNAAPLSGCISLSRTDLGLHDLEYQNQKVELECFALRPRGSAVGQQKLDLGAIESFVRQRDLVAIYPESQRQPFAAQIYWRFWNAPQQVAGVDLHILLQTSLLESFPELTCANRFPAAELVIFDDDGAEHDYSPTKHELLQEKAEKFPAILVRVSNNPWSYLEVIQPMDNCGWKLERFTSGGGTIGRTIGGGFQEKGVIRRFRLRSAFMPRAQDLHQAQTCIHEFGQERLPLTT